MHKLKKPYLTVKIFMYGGRHTVIVLCCLVGHKTIVCISKKNSCLIPKATCCPKHLGFQELHKNGQSQSTIPNACSTEMQTSPILVFQACSTTVSAPTWA